MRVAVIGGSGFIGRKFIELYKDKFDSIVSLNSQNAPLNNFNKVLKNTQEVDVLVHTAFDHNYKDNIIGIKNILKVCEQNNIKKLIYISTVSVYNPDISGNLDENSPYSNINDPYSKEKRKIESEFDRYKDSDLNIIILQPSIVYGLGGNWTKYALHVCKSKTLLLPNEGNSICNAVYVDDVALAIYNSCISSLKYEKILISGKENVTWKEFYQQQCKILKELGLQFSCNIENNKSKNEFHSRGIINFVFILWFKTPLGNVFDLMIGILKKIRAMSYKNTSSNADMKIFLESNINNNILVPLGITKKVHSCKFFIDISKAKKLLNYEPNCNFSSGIEKIKKDIEEILI